MTKPGRPRLKVDEPAIIEEYQQGVPILRLAQRHGVDRYVIRRVLDEHHVPRNRRHGQRYKAEGSAQ
jgi:hypothetical protein